MAQVAAQIETHILCADKFCSENRTVLRDNVVK